MQFGPLVSLPFCLRKTCDSVVELPAEELVRLESAELSNRTRTSRPAWFVAKIFGQVLSPNYIKSNRKLYV